MPFWSRDKVDIFSMIPHGMLCLSNVFRIRIANRKVGKTDSMLILQNNINKITENFQNLPRFRSLPILPYNYKLSLKIKLIYKLRLNNYNKN